MIEVQSGDRLLLIGPPGTGKTTALMGIAGDLLRYGWEPDDFAIVSFTRAAVGEIRERLCKVRDGEWDGVSTLHSAAMKLSGCSKVMKEAEWTLFNRLCNFTTTPVTDPVDVPISTADDAIRMVHSYARNKMVSLAQARGQSPFTAAPGRLEAFDQHLAAFKREMDCVDFTDLIEICVANKWHIRRPILIIDEAQDLSPLQIAFLQPAIAAASIVVVAGDDDQAIFEFQGASPAWIRSLHGAEGWRTHILGKSWRCPEAVRLVGNAVIGAARDRVPKEYESTGRAGTASWDLLPSALKKHCLSAENSVMVLCRGGKQCTAATNLLFALGVPYNAERGYGPKPYANTSAIEAIEVFSEIGRGSSQSIVAVVGAIDKFCRSKKAGDDGFIPRGIKAKLKKLCLSSSTITVAELREAGCGPLVDVCELDPFSAFQKSVEPRTINYLKELHGKHGKLPEPMVTVTTWHSSKGREANTVIVWAELPSPCAKSLQHYQHREAEIRSAYVAVTRARDTLVLCPAENAQNAYPFPRLS